ncbi:hypothetical protein ABDK00_013535 [Niabella insulamsoli]|uniref:hypothetical protein n=1 Tax=Niabella insulamsoli TaxID=3144874 RepID=UPI0031FC365D
MIIQYSREKYLGTFITLWIFLFLGNNYSWANAAQPGIWNAGGTVFTMLYPEDSVAFKKVQMEQEEIYIQLYKGYAVVKGVYLFRNTSGKDLRFKMGYPVNGIYAGGAVDLNEVLLDSLSRFKIRAGGNWLPLLKEAHPELNHDEKSPIPSGDNWMVWEMAFGAEEAKTVEVYFLVNTNEAGIRSGYNHERKNAFIYLLESGSVWRQPIEKGQFYVQLMDGLTLKDLHGLSAGFGFRYNESHRLFSGQKLDFSPTPKDNLVATYYSRMENFLFDPVASKADSLFTKIDAMHILPLQTLVYTNVETGDPYQVETTFWGALPGLITLFVIVAPFLIGLIFILIVVWAIVRWRRIQKERKK